MKCIQCQTDNTLTDRTGNYGRCKQCQHPFVFEPTSMGTVKLTDGLFAKAIADLSANDTLFFTSQQLLYLLDKRLQKKLTLNPKALAIVCGVFTLFTFAIFVGPTLAKGILFPLLLPGAINLLFAYLLFKQSTFENASAKIRQLSARFLTIQGLLILVAGAILALTVKPVIFLLALVLSSPMILFGWRQYQKQANSAQTLLVQPDTFQSWLTSWQAINPIAKLLPPPDETALPAEVSADVSAYSFDRLVVTDTAAIAQLLIANNFHFENNCAILSITGYPQSIFQITMEMLRRNPDLKVYAFHNCSGRGINLVYQLQSSPQWFQTSAVEIIDVGLRPNQVMALNNVLVERLPGSADAAKRVSDLVRQQFSQSELAWLDAGNVVLLESFPPQRLIQVLNRSIAAGSALVEGTSSDMILIGDSGSSYYSVESFG